MSHSEDVVIRVRNLSKFYKLYNSPKERLKESLSITRKKYHKEFYALNNISFDVKKGETVGIIGKNGSGKSTLLKILTGVLTPTSGEVEVKGKVSALLELGAGFNPEYTGIENIYLQGTIMGFTKEEMDEKLDEILQFADIGDFVYQPVKTYSSGMFARLAFAVAINVEPNILIVDEALAVGDVKFQAKCFNRFKDLKDKGVTILFVTHDISSVRNFCDRAIWINEGVLKSSGDTVQVTAEYMEYMNSSPEVKENIEKSSSLQENLQEDLNEKTVFNPINRWGSHKGLIKSMKLLNSKNKDSDIFEIGERMELIFKFYVPDDINIKTLSAAFSIKNTMGMDLIVSTTFDQDILRINQSGCYVQASFEFINPLNVGEYIVVLALEDRSSVHPKYYDYIEGAKYFKVISSKKRFGMFTLPVNQKYIYLKG
jgi:teichoic acid transport system ATP-binding protein